MSALPSPPNTAPFRAPAQPDTFLNKNALRFLAALPGEVFPCELARRFPRIVNQLVEHWGNISKTERYLQELLVSDRPGRQGFPPAVVRELIALTEHYQTQVCKTVRPCASVWDHDPHTLRPH